MPLIEKVGQALRTYLPASPFVLTAALSGGRDSVCLLSALKDLLPEGVKLQAVHVNHHLRADADRDEAFCRELCEKWRIPFFAAHVYPEQESAGKGLSLEDAARSLRYEALSERAGDGWIVLAHHEKDQAETVLLHLLRGSGLSGLTGMKELSPYGSGRTMLFRPMLKVSEEEIDAYIDERSLDFVEDETNRDLRYDRNRVRHELIPELKTFNPRIVPSLSRMAGLLAQDDDYLEKAASEALASVRATDGNLTGISAGKVLTLPPAIRSRVLQQFLGEQGLSKDLFSVHLAAVEDLAKGPSGRQISLPKSLTLMKSYDILSIYQCAFFERPDIVPGEAFFVPEDEAASLRSRWEDLIRPADSREKWLCGDGLADLPVWRYRQSGDYMYVKTQDGALGKKLLQDILVDDRIPLAERDRIPVLAEGPHVLWLAGGRICHSVRLRKDMDRILYAHLTI